MAAHLRFTLLPLLLVIGTTSSFAQDTCLSYVDQTVQPQRPNALWRKLSSIPKVKDEFETTQAFEARVIQSLGSNVGPVIVEIPLQRNNIKYDADNRSVEVQSYAFSNYSTKYSGVFGYGTPFDGKVKYGSRDNINIVFPSEESSTGSYIGTNAMGVRIRVQKVKRLTRAIFERDAKFEEGLFSKIDVGPTKYVGTVLLLENISPDMAREMKAKSRGAVVFAPKAPFYAKGKFDWGDPTIDGPMDIDETIEVVVGDIQCALLLNSAGKVIGAVTTQ